MMQPNAGINIPADAPSWAVTLMVQNAQAVDDLKGMVREMDGKFDQHIAEGAEVKADIAVLKNNTIPSGDFRALQAKHDAMQKEVDGLKGWFRMLAGAVVVAIVGAVFHEIGLD